MQQFINYIQEYPIIALIGAGILLLLAGAIFRKLKIIALILIIAAGLVYYVLLDAGKVGKVDVNGVKKTVNEKVDVKEIKKTVKEKVMEKL